MRFNWPEGARPEPRELKADPWAEAWVETLRKQHEQADHGVYAIEAFVCCYEGRFHPPQWLVDWLGERLASWKDDETESVDEALALSSPGRGRQPPLKQLNHYRERYFDAFVINTLVTECEIPIDEAAEMVQLRNEAWGRETPDASWLAESYRKKWRKQLSGNGATLKNEDARASFLSSFPKVR